MPIDTTDVSTDQINRILESQEGHFLDLKAKEVAPAKLTKSLSAFANADGGELYVGISEDKTKKSRTWSGFANIEAANGHLQALEGLFHWGRTSHTFFSAARKSSGSFFRSWSTRPATSRRHRTAFRTFDAALKASPSTNPKK